jgi:hypothetical protein
MPNVDVETMQSMMVVIATGGTIDDARARGLIRNDEHARVFAAMSQEAAEAEDADGLVLEPPDNLY